MSAFEFSLLILVPGFAIVFWILNSDDSSPSQENLKKKQNQMRFLESMNL